MKLWVNVANIIHTKLPGTRFLLAGGGPLFDRTRDEVHAKGLDDVFVFLGEVAYKDLPPVYGAADIFLLTSDYEGFGRVIVEAHLAGLPVVSTMCTGPEDIIVEGDSGYLCRPGDAEGLANAVIALLSDKDKLTRFGAAGRKRVQSMFSRERLADDLVQMWVSA